MAIAEPVSVYPEAEFETALVSVIDDALEHFRIRYKELWQSFRRKERWREPIQMICVGSFWRHMTGVKAAWRNWRSDLA
jgi:hypothetical protein